MDKEKKKLKALVDKIDDPETLHVLHSLLNYLSAKIKKEKPYTIRSKAPAMLNEAKAKYGKKKK